MSRFANGGLERVQINLANALQQRGLEIVIVAGQITEKAFDGSKINVPTIEIAKRGAWEFVFSLISLLRRKQVDCIFTSSNDVACIVLMLRPFLAPATRIIVAQHLSLSGPMHHAHGISLLKLRLTYAALRRLLPRADAVIAVSEGVANEISEILSIDRAKIDVVYNPIVTAEFALLTQEPVIWPWPDKHVPVIVFVGRLSREKRLDLLLDACQPLLRANEARLLVVGSGPQKDWMAAEVDARGLGPSCHFTGFVQNVFPFIANSDVLVLPSDYEGFGNVLVEAMACGVQVISTDCPHGPAEILGDGAYGQLVSSGNRAELEGAIRSSLAGKFRVAPALLTRRAKDFDLETSAAAYLAITTRATEQTKRAEQFGL